ncbi:hypothetical protein CONPUDRAFT_160308 [Coniophora puteana RWD-64-598 SS2]|uniref:HMG box domain-containing protein n=1 Tax=Coniophora puteana (strain RWD-64-598) TaxID=741705 RepID=R7SEJ3_CONPW|nr:uncharacterized protein CONPUDRAFT_160308 [Coniophora puteana RWD-64-598 SS2]EIW74265.1 hypothetical protein CONPUDRAFT_160308 [Coniophora puteana RWD-64-598 SS2]
MRYSRHPMWWVAVPTSRGGTATHPIGKWLYPTRDLLYQTAEWVPTTLLSDHLTTIPHLNQLIAPGAAAASLANALGSSLASSPPSSMVALPRQGLSLPLPHSVPFNGPRRSRLDPPRASHERERVTSGFSDHQDHRPPQHRSIVPGLVGLHSVPDSVLPSASLGNAAALAAPSLSLPHEYALPGSVLVPVTSASAFTKPPDRQRLIFAGKQLGRMSLRQPRKPVKTLQTSVLKPPPKACAFRRIGSNAAKEAGQEYAELSAAEKEPYKRKSAALKQERERQNAKYMKTLTPDDIKRENAYRTVQRKASKSRKSNFKDPNAPKKPLSAYFMFLQRIRSDPALVREVFGDELEFLSAFFVTVQYTIYDTSTM